MAISLQRVNRVFGVSRSNGTISGSIKSKMVAKRLELDLFRMR